MSEGDRRDIRDIEDVEVRILLRGGSSRISGGVTLTCFSPHLPSKSGRSSG